MMFCHIRLIITTYNNIICYTNSVKLLLLPKNMALIVNTYLQIAALTDKKQPKKCHGTFGVCFVVAFPGHLWSLSFSKRVKLIHNDLCFITGKIIVLEVDFVLYCNDQVFFFFFFF